jgi:hypothetical protein
MQHSALLGQVIMTPDFWTTAGRSVFALDTRPAYCHWICETGFVQQSHIAFDLDDLTIEREGAYD